MFLDCLDHPGGIGPETNVPDEQAANEIFSLPMYPSLTDAEQDRVCEALHEILPYDDSWRDLSVGRVRRT